MSKYSVGVYSTTPVDWKADRSAALQAEIAARPKVPVTRKADGAGTIETYTRALRLAGAHRRHHRPAGRRRSRFMALTEDPDLVALLERG